LEQRKGMAKHAEDTFDDNKLERRE
jgi:hypothetical protein